MNDPINPNAIAAAREEQIDKNTDSRSKHPLLEKARLLPSGMKKIAAVMAITTIHFMPQNLHNFT